jgi:uncharacterized protein
MKAPPAKISGTEYVEQFAHEQAINREVLTNRGFDLDGRGWKGRWRTDRKDMLERLRHRLVRGPKRAGSSRDMAICAPSTSVSAIPPAIIDCLEFSRRLRLVDPLDELVFLTSSASGWGPDGSGSASSIPVPRPEGGTVGRADVVLLGLSGMLARPSQSGSSAGR